MNVRKEVNSIAMVFGRSVDSRNYWDHIYARSSRHLDGVTGLDILEEEQRGHNTHGECFFRNTRNVRPWEKVRH
jgi:hypothetical protein